VRCAVAAVLFGASTPAASRLAANMSAFTLAGLLYLGAAVAVLPFTGPLRSVSRRRVGSRLGTAVLLGGGIAPVLLAAGLHDVSAATVSLLLNLELVFTAVLAVVVFREFLGWRLVTGTSLVVAASATLGWSGTAHVRWGALLVAGACLCWAADNGITARLDELAPVHITLAKGLVAGGVNLTIGVITGGVPPTRSVLFALLVGAVGYGASITLWIAGARDLGAARGQLVFATAPFVGAVLAWTVLGEATTGRQVVSLLIAAAGVSFVLYSDHEHLHSHTPIEHDHAHTHDDQHHDHPHAPGRAVARHVHRHEHVAVVHPHPHVPDLHHRHRHPRL